MLQNTKIFSSFAVDNKDKTKYFYNQKLGLNVQEDHNMPG
jgi:hypothetical protein